MFFLLLCLIYGGETIDDWNEIIKEAESTGVFSGGGAIQPIFKGDTVMVVKEDEERGMVLIQKMDGLDEDTKWWTPVEDLALAKGK